MSQRIDRNSCEIQSSVKKEKNLNFFSQRDRINISMNKCKILQEENRYIFVISRDYETRDN